MTVKELKEQINKDPSKLDAIEENLVVQMGLLKLFDGDLRIEDVIQNHSIKVEVINTLINIYKKYDNTLDKESKKFIDYVIARYPHLMFDYELVDENTTEIKYQYIFNNKLKKGSIQYQKGDISILCYERYIGQMLQDIGAEMEKEINNNNNIQQSTIKLAVNNLKR